MRKFEGANPVPEQLPLLDDPSQQAPLEHAPLPTADVVPPVVEQQIVPPVADQLVVPPASDFDMPGI